MNWFYKTSQTDGGVRIWLDDERPMPAHFNVHCKTAPEAISLLQQGNVVAISLDHDLGLGEGIGNGYDVAKLIEEGAAQGTLPPIRLLTLHTANPIGRQRMAMALQNAKRYWAQNQQQQGQ